MRSDGWEVAEHRLDERSLPLEHLAQLLAAASEQRGGDDNGKGTRARKHAPSLHRRSAARREELDEIELGQDPEDVTLFVGDQRDFTTLEDPR